MIDWRTFKKRKKRGIRDNFNPNSEYIAQAVTEYCALGGQVTVLPSRPNEFETNDFNIENEATENVNLRGIYD